MTSIEETLIRLGVEIVGGSNARQIKARCPVHKMAVGKEDRHPSWYMNATTGAWLCFSCGQSGSLSHLAELLGFDETALGRIPIEIMKSKVASWSDEAQDELLDVDEDESPEATVYISEYAFLKNPLPPPAVRELRDVSREACDLLNVRWSREGRCWLIPIYDFTGQLLGWQEKSKGYFNNVPDGVPKRISLFGFQVCSGGKEIVLVESPLDVVRLLSHGINNVVATYGAYVSNEQLTAATDVLDRNGAVVLALDDDDAGVEATERCGAWLKRNGKKVRYFKYPPRKTSAWAKDPGELHIDYVRLGLTNASSIRVS